MENASVQDEKKRSIKNTFGSHSQSGGRVNRWEWFKSCIKVCPWGHPRRAGHGDIPQCFPRVKTQSDSFHPACAVLGSLSPRWRQHHINQPIPTLQSIFHVLGIIRLLHEIFPRERVACILRDDEFRDRELPPLVVLAAKWWWGIGPIPSSQLYRFLPVQPWAGNITSLNLFFFTCETGGKEVGQSGWSVTAM